MTGLSLRPYQAEARDAIRDEWDQGRTRTLLVLPTGCGKTIVFSAVAKAVVDEGGRVLILAHRGELLDQAADKMERMTGLGCSREKAEDTCLGQWFRVVVGSVQTLMRPKRLAKFAPDYFDAIIIDEAHHAISSSYQAVLEHFTEAHVLGVTATPDRGDQVDLGQVFDSIAYSYSLPSAIHDGYLCPIKAQTVPLKLDLAGVAMSAGDYKASDVDTALDPYLPRIADEMIAAGCMDRKTVVFLPLIKTSQKFAGILSDKGFDASEVNGESDDRAEVLERFDAAGCGTVLCNSMLLTEGWDCPSVDCIVVLRATKVRSLYVQMVGRGTRLSPDTGKTELLVLDFLWHTETHALCHPAHLIAESDEVADAMTERFENAAETGCPLDLEAVERQAAEDVVAAREESLAKQLDACKKRKRKLVDPLQFEMSIQAEDLANWEPSFPWEMAPASDKQLAALEKFGIFGDEVTCAGKASLLLERLQKRRTEGLSTARQIKQLEARGFKHVGQWSFDSANAMISRIAALGWRSIPRGIDPATYDPRNY